ncbi:acetaldehyde dehydrogenase, partial [Lachnotalea glycerini]
SGTPAIGDGPGNGPAYIEKTADLSQAVKRIMDSKTFDNGTICASEQSVICDTEMADEVQKEMERQGAYFLSEAESAKLGHFILRANGTMNPAIVGKSVQTIAELSGLSIPQNARVIVAKEDGIGRGHPYSNEKLAPILAFYTAENYEKVCDIVQKILHYEGAGHTFSMHTQDERIVEYFSMRAPASRILVNTPSALGGIGGSTGLMPALTLGCGAIGGSATSENVGPMNLLNLRYVAFGLRELDQIRKDIPSKEDGALAMADINSVSVEKIVKKITERLQTA